MAETSIFTFVVGYRDRDLENARRFLDSLTKQTLQGSRLIFVDYGSSTSKAQAARQLVGRYPFAQYIYTDTRGKPWNRSHALNIGIRLVQTEYVITTDIDMLYTPDFLEIVVGNLDPGRVLHCSPYWLTQGFDDWEHPEKHLASLHHEGRGHAGGFQCVQTAILHELRGFDEFYRYWGREDADLNSRLRQSGLEDRWLNELGVPFFHQWHPKANYMTPTFMPAGVWGRLVMHHWQNMDVLQRNDAAWGHVEETSERAVLRFVDPDSGCLRESDSLRMFDESPTSNHSIHLAAAVFQKREPGQAMAVNHAFYPSRNRWADRIIRHGNRLLNRLGYQNTRLDYDFNMLHSFLVEYIEKNPELVADYYMNLPALNGVTVLVRQ
jgi:glycosyltransferase involved in cell wall biosynthesis